LSLAGCRPDSPRGESSPDAGLAGAGGGDAAGTGGRSGDAGAAGAGGEASSGTGGSGGDAGRGGTGAEAGSGGDAGGAGAASCGDGVLDPGELCDPGLSPCCDASCAAAAGPTRVCRQASAACDAVEHCDGTGFDCPADAVLDQGTACRAQAGACDLADTCDGVLPGCADARLPATTLCRAAVDSCDAAELCSGSSAACPADAPDHCAISLLGATLPQDVSGDTTATCDVFAPSCAGAGDNDQAFVFSAPEDAVYDFNTLGSSFDTSLYVLDGASCAALELGCDDDYLAAPSSRLILALEQGQVVVVVVDGWDSGDHGAFQLHVDRVPAAFSCDPLFWGADDGCDCGCGLGDPDCSSANVQACDYCNEDGSCAEGAAGCLGSIDPTENSQCQSGPPLPVWTCNAAHYGTGNGCDCGCGIPDPDCAGSAASLCAHCNRPGSCDTTGNGCAGIIDPIDNASCDVPGWTCQVDLYGGDDGCDCGCGLLDPDCLGDSSASACDFCNDPGSCDPSGDGCPGAIDPLANDQCQ
jgi:hypothetical protein